MSTFGGHTCEGNPRTRLPTTDVVNELGLTVIGGKAYVYGGRKLPGGQQGADYAWSYDIDADNWTYVGPMNFARHSHSVIALGEDEVLIAGN